MGKKKIIIITIFLLILSLVGCSQNKGESKLQVKEVHEGYVEEVSGVSISNCTEDSISLRWNKVEHGDGYRIDRATTRDGEYDEIATIEGNSNTEYTDSKLESSKTYYYKVRAYRISGKVTLYSKKYNIFEGTTKAVYDLTKIYEDFLASQAFINHDDHETVKAEKYALLDLNNDGIKELLVTDSEAFRTNLPGGDEANGYMYAYVYTYKNGQVIYSGYVSGSSMSALYVDSKGRLGYWWGNRGVSIYSYYGLNSQGKVTITRNMYYMDYERYEKTIDTYDKEGESKGININESEYREAEKMAENRTMLEFKSVTNYNKSKISEEEAKEILKNYFISELNEGENIPNYFYMDEIISNKYHIQASYESDDGGARAGYGWWYVDMYTGKIFKGDMTPCN